MEKTTGALIVITACPNEALAKSLARGLVEKKLAACVNIVPHIRSYFRWQGKIQEAEEFLLIIKTDRCCYADLEACILQEHTYELPEIICSPISGLEPYLAWITDSTKPSNI